MKETIKDKAYGIFVASPELPLVDIEKAIMQKCVACEIEIQEKYKEYEIISERKYDFHKMSYDEISYWHKGHQLEPPRKDIDYYWFEYPIKMRLKEENEQTDRNDTQSDTNTTPEGSNSPGDRQ